MAKIDVKEEDLGLDRRGASGVAREGGDPGGERGAVVCWWPDLLGEMFS
jgi:hypothetical protein